MKLLALDTASSACSVALQAEGSLIAARRAEMERGHAEALVPMVDAVMAEAAQVCPAGFGDLDCIAVTVGPGAFTGVRIGLAAAGGMAAAAGLPLVGLTTLEVVAAAEPAGGLPLLVALNSKRSDVYVQLFGADGAPSKGAQALMPDAIPDMVPDGPVALTGDGAAPVQAALKTAGCDVRRLSGSGCPDAAVLARLAEERYGGGLPLPPVGVLPPPIYLRAPDVTLPARR
jgi:tRNA threonylcarbamoyladenosine biosynthesis protein TsaB